MGISLEMSKNWIEFSLGDSRTANMKEPNPDPDSWGDDPLSKEISSQIAGMPDRPRVVIALISSSDDGDSNIIRAMAPHKAAFLNVHAIKVFDIPYRLFYFGFDSDTGVALSDFFATLSTLPFMQAGIYVEGHAAMRLTKVKLSG
jgi:hypothetical protein